MTTVAFCEVIPITPHLPEAVLSHDYFSAWSIGTGIDCQVDYWTQKFPSINSLYNIAIFSSSFKESLKTIASCVNELFNQKKKSDKWRH